MRVTLQYQSTSRFGSACYQIATSELSTPVQETTKGYTWLCDDGSEWQVHLLESKVLRNGRVVTRGKKSKHGGLGTYRHWRGAVKVDTIVYTRSCRVKLIGRSLNERLMLAGSFYGVLVISPRLNVVAQQALIGIAMLSRG